MSQILLLTVHLPGTEIGVLGGFVLVEDASGDSTLDFHSSWAHLSADEAEVLDAMEETLRTYLQDCKNTGRDFVEILQTQFLNTVRSDILISKEITSSQFRRQGANRYPGTESRWR